MPNKFIHEAKRKVRQVFVSFVERSGSRRFNLYLAIGYNCLIVALVVAVEMTSHDKTGQGLIAIPGFLMLATPLHGIFSFFKGLKQSFKTGLLNTLFIVGVNILLFFADILLVVLIFNLLAKLGLVQ